MEAIRESSYPNLIYRGKVRDTHDIGNNKFLMVSTDRISAYDVVLPSVVPGKGSVLNQISSFWFGKTEHIVKNHFIELGLDTNDLKLEHGLATRGMIVKKADRVDVECIVRGYITGSAWSEYKSTGKVSGMSMPEGLKEGDKFPNPLFTPTTKADEGHDENMTMQEVIDMVGVETTDKLTELSINIYNYAHDFALDTGIIIADTKMEFGFIDGELCLIDELLTPDSSRFWDTVGYEPGKSQPNFDKQYVRDWLNSQGWDHNPPAPELPEDVVNITRDRYTEAFTRLTGQTLR